MVGITKRQSNNTKKTGIALAQGKKKQLFKKKTVKPITDNFEVESMEVGTSPVIVKVFYYSLLRSSS
ncbi:unnamed protein product [Auanema sp. JU1783]|nr:unnamed protein product [Auanema sp. JU1783]